MGRITRRLLAVAFVVLGAGAAAAQSILSGGSPGIDGGNPGIAQGTVTPDATATTPNTATATPGGTTAATGAAATPSTGVSASVGTTPSPSAGAVTVDEIVAIARTVESGSAAVSAFTVPSGRRLVITDIVVTNPATAANCGAAVMPGGAGTATTTTTTPTTAPATTVTGTTTLGTPTTSTTTTTPGGSTVTTPTTPTTSTTMTTPGGSTVTTPGTPAIVESGTGTLCVPAQTSLSLPLTTGLEFTAGETVQLANQPLATTAPAGASAATTAGGPLLYHLRGFLVTSA
jgi:hypothetical protein